MFNQTYVLLNPGLSSKENSVDPDQLASGEAIQLASALFSASDSRTPRRFPNWKSS